MATLSPLPTYTEPPGPTQRPSISRRETILSLVELLLKENETGNTHTSHFEDDKDVPTVDEHLQAVGAEAFHKFQRRINSLDRELRNFANSARQLGSSVAILSSTFHLRERLAQILFLYHQNAASLFPRRIARMGRDNVLEAHIHDARKGHWKRIKYKGPPHIARPTISEKLNFEDFPTQLEALALDVTTFLNCLNEFPEFTDEAVNASILSFEGDLKYWSSCLKEYAGHFRYPSVQRYIHDLSVEMGQHIDNITSALSMFIEVGVPTIRFAQKHGATNLLNLSTIATFFSAVTATVLQYSFASLDTAIANAVNCFWFTSLVFSIAAAVNSLLGLTWKQAMYRSPGHRVPWWVLIWIKRSPLVFLVISNACFSIGLCCFAYASRQHHVTSTITTVFTAITSFGLVAVSAWFACERWAFQRHHGKKWLSDILTEIKSTLLRITPIRQLVSGLDYIRHKWTVFRQYLRRRKQNASAILPLHAGDTNSTTDTNISPPGSPQRTFTDLLFRTQTMETMNQHTVHFPRTMSMPDLGGPPSESETPTTPRSSTPAKQLWEKALSNVLTRPTLAQIGLAAVSASSRDPSRQRTASSNVTNHGEHRRASAEESVQAVFKSRISGLIPKLRVLETTQDMTAHHALVRHLQFSPDGRYLATSSWDRTSIIFRVGEPFTFHRVLAHSQGFVGQVAWSPTGNLLLTRLSRGIRIWSADDGACKNTIDRHVPVEAVTWCPDGQAFISVEGNIVTKLDLDGKVLGTYNFGNMKLQDVAVSPDSTWLLGVGPLLKSPTGLRPSKSRAEKRLVVYNMETDMIENQTPVLNDVKDVTLAASPRGGVMALVSYESKAPPQLWKVDFIRDRFTHSQTTRLTLRHTYLPKSPVDFAGPSYFGGKNNELVLCAGKAGDIHIWDQESGVLLHHIRTQANAGDLTCIAWNHAAEDPFMFATGSHDGAVRIWTNPNLTDPHDSFIPRATSPIQIPGLFAPSSSVLQLVQGEYEMSASSSRENTSQSGRDRVVAFAN
ncbi:hypothetical protein AMATHDRAFT_196130 [Amanita thiersii Skay4041]|uniref:Anaphase-promoting complex subunit 4 WD40 domain-containing protein n=1 Tax=Amanita thiersii Skay4041 TaxID=703135 RepID=A0A2A9NDK9_9AGAR|nr:hypothetical protein AMATHDRAFT_196130 [Amanita thiersii Skay4041]